MAAQSETTGADPASPSGRRALGDIVVQVVGRLANGLLGVVVVVLVARVLGAEDFGRWTTLISLIALAGPLSEVGITQVAVARAAADPEEEAGWLGALVAIRTVLALVAGAACLTGVVILGDGGSMRLAGLLLTVTVLLGGISALSAIFQLHVRNDLLIVSITVNSVVWTGAVVAVGLTGGGLVALAAGFLGAALVSFAVQTVIALRRARVSFAGWRRRGRELVRVGLPLSISTLLIVAYVRIDQILVFSIAGERAAGLYGSAYRILDQAIVIPLSVATTLYPMLVRAHTVDPARLRFLLQRALEVLVALGLGALAFAIPCGGDALALLFGEEFRGAGATLAILMGVFLVTSVNYLNGSLILIFELQKRMLVISAVGLVANLALNIVLIPRYGFVASAWATLVTELVVVVLTSTFTLRALGWRPDVSVATRALLAAALTSVALTLLRGTVPIGALLSITPLLYGGLLVALGGVRVAETIAIVRPRARA